jgi:predicted nucleic acid-binding protein
VTPGRGPRYLLDTGPLAAYLFGRPAARGLMSPWVRARTAATSPVVYAEVTEYLLGHPDAARRQRELRELLRVIRPYALTFAILERYARLRRQLRPPRGPGLIGDLDALLAATALERGLTVVTTDGDFRRVPGLEVLVVAVR